MSVTRELAPNGLVWWSGKNKREIDAQALGRTDQRWTPDECAEIMSGRLSVQALARLLQRSVKAIYDKRRLLRAEAIKKGAMNYGRLTKDQRRKEK